MVQRALAAFVLAAACSVLAACGGGSSGSTPVVLPSPAGTATPSPSPSPTAAPPQSSQTSAPLSSSGSSAALPAFGGYGGTITFAAGSVPASTIATIATSLTPQGGTPQLSGHARHVRSVPASAALLYVNVTLNNTVTFTNTGPKFSFSLPSVATASNYYVAYLDPTASPASYDDLYQDRTVLNGTTISFLTGDTGKQYTLVAGKTYTFVLYVLPGSTPVAFPVDLTVAPPCQVGVPCGPFLGYNDDVNSGGALLDANGLPVPLPSAPTFTSSDTSIITVSNVTSDPVNNPGPYFAELKSTQKPGRVTLSITFPVGGFATSAPIGAYNTFVIGCGNAFTFASGSPVQTSTANADLFIDCNTSPATYHFPYGVHTYGDPNNTISALNNAAGFTQDATLLYATSSSGLSKETSGNILDVYAVLFKTQSGQYVKWRPNVQLGNAGTGIAGPYLVSDAGGNFAY